MTTAIIFDFFGVLCNELRGRLVFNYGKAPGAAEKINTILDEADLGYMSYAECCAQLGKVIGMTSEQVGETMLRMCTIDQQMIQLVAVLHRAYKIGLCSNAPDGLVQKLLDAYALKQHFDVIKISSEAHVKKPSSVLYMFTLSDLGAVPEEAVFIDDTIANVTEAEGCGMKAIHFTGFNDLVKKLQELSVV
jgi:putative hydrolase of the HAD superfamily